jgi:hypothetical protein
MITRLHVIAVPADLHAGSAGVKPLAYTKTFSMAAAGDGTVPLGQIAKVRQA